MLGSLQDGVAGDLSIRQVGGRLVRIRTDGVAGLLRQLQLLTGEKVLGGSKLVQGGAVESPR